jgi:hypothetical protein
MESRARRLNLNFGNAGEISVMWKAAENFDNAVGAAGLSTGPG